MQAQEPANTKNPYIALAIRSAIIVALGLALLMQPWVAVLRILGGLLLACGIALGVISTLRARSLKGMLAQVLISSKEGMLCRQCAIYNGTLHAFSTVGCVVEACAYEEGVLTFVYSLQMKNRRERETLAFSVEDGQKAAAHEAVAYFGKSFALPEQTGSAERQR